jgi:hypothetical protein
MVSLPGTRVRAKRGPSVNLTRQSILFKEMDARIKSAHDED